MNSGQTPTDPTLLFLGPFPQPVHGQSLATQRLFDFLQAQGVAVQAIDTGEGKPGVLATARRLFRLFRSLQEVRRPSEWIYISVNSGSGLWFTERQARRARQAGKRLVLHHHVYRYIGEHDPRMEKLADAAGPDAIHLANCDAMAALLRGQYPAIGTAIGYGNAGFVESSLAKLPMAPMDGGHVTLGHMSNLTTDKGVGRVVDVFTAAMERGLPVKLLLAGPYGDEEAEGIVQQALQKYPGDVTYMGPVYGDQKAQFFAETDIFLFPTRYKNEAGPIVLHEAMASGSPAVSTDQCCIPSMLEGGGGLSLAMDAADPIGETLSFIEAYIAAPQDHAAAAREKYFSLLDDQSKREEEFVAMFKT